MWPKPRRNGVGPSSRMLIDHIDNYFHASNPVLPLADGQRLLRPENQGKARPVCQETSDSAALETERGISGEVDHSRPQDDDQMSQTYAQHSQKKSYNARNNERGHISIEGCHTSQRTNIQANVADHEYDCLRSHRSPVTFIDSRSKQDRALMVLLGLPTSPQGWNKSLPMTSASRNVAQAPNSHRTEQGQVAAKDTNDTPGIFQTLPYYFKCCPNPICAYAYMGFRSKTT